MEPILKGRFNIWQTPDGGYHIAYVADDDDSTKHLDIPGAAIRMANMFADGKITPLKILKSLSDAKRSDDVSG